MLTKTEELEWIGTTRLAGILDVTPMSIWRWQHDEKLEFPRPAIINRKKLWRRADIEAWMVKRVLAHTARRALPAKDMHDLS